MAIGYVASVEYCALLSGPYVFGLSTGTFICRSAAHLPRVLTAPSMIGATLNINFLKVSVSDDTSDTKVMVVQEKGKISASQWVNTCSQVDSVSSLP